MGSEENPQVRALAEHLMRSGAQFYGAFWCPHCQEQKALFGTSSHRLPYIECSPQGRHGPQAPICQAMHIQSYSTWIINGRRYEGVLTLKELADYSGFHGVLNLSPLEEESFREIYRVLKSNGRLQFADIVLEEDLPAEVVESLEAWSD